MCILLSRFCNRYIILLLSILSITLSWNYIPHNDIFTRYLNPFNFILYFELGKIVREKDLRIKNYINSLIVSIMIMVLTGILWPSLQPTYFSIICIPFVMAALVFFDSLLKLLPMKFLITMGKYSYVIYLCHIQIAGIINGRMHGGLMEILKVPIAFILTFAFVAIVYQVVSNTNKEGKLLKYLGFR